MNSIELHSKNMNTQKILMLLMFCSHFYFYLGVYHGKSYPDIAAVKSRDVALNDNYQYLPVTEKRFSEVVTSFLMLFTSNLLICSGVFEFVYSSAPSKVSSGGSCRLMVSGAITSSYSYKQPVECAETDHRAGNLAKGINIT